MDTVDTSPTEQWLREVLDPCEEKSPAAREGFLGWIRSLSFRRSVSENSEANEDPPVECPELAPYPLSEDTKDNQCSFLLQGKEGDGDRPRCWLFLLALNPFGGRQMKQLLDEAKEVCSQCRQSLLLHRGVYMCGERRILLTFSNNDCTNSWLRCGECKSKWTVPQERLLQMPASMFFSLLWFCQHELPCGHDFANSSWEIGNAVLEVKMVEALHLELRGPQVVPNSPDCNKQTETSALKEKLSAVLQRAEKLVESHLSNVLRDFRQVGPGGQVPKRNAWFWNQSDERALKCALRSRCLLEASSILRRCATKLQAWRTDGTRLVDLGITCHLHNCLEECYQLLEDDLEKPSADSDSEDDTFHADPPSQAGGSRMSLEVNSARGLLPKVIARGKLTRRCTDIGFAMPKRDRARSLSAPPKFGIQEEQKCKDEARSLDDSSLESLLHVGVPRLASMDPRNILKRFYASLVGEGKNDAGDIEQPGCLRVISATSTGGDPLDTWPVLCAEPRRLLESTGQSETYSLSVPCGVQGMAIPLPGSLAQTDDLGAVIAHALLSLQHWEQLRPRLAGHCLVDELDDDLCVAHCPGRPIDFASIDGEESVIRIAVQAPDGTRWQVEALAPLRFHLLRHLAFGNDANFCEMLRRCRPHSTSGGKSKSAFWKSECGQLMLKEVRAAEASHLASKAGPFAVRLAEALRGEPSLLCEVFGLFRVGRLGKRPSTRTIIIMRNLLNGITDDWQIFDIKGAAHRNMPPAPSADPEASTAPSSPSAVKWDGGFVETFGALPKVLKPVDHEALELALKCDLHVLRELGLVDYSLLMAFHPKANRIRLAIIDFLQPYTLNKQLESTMKKLVQRHEPTIVEPVQYAKRFHEFIRKAFQAAVGSMEVM